MISCCVQRFYAFSFRRKIFHILRSPLALASVFMSPVTVRSSKPPLELSVSLTATTPLSSSSKHYRYTKRTSSTSQRRRRRNLSIAHTRRKKTMTWQRMESPRRIFSTVVDGCLISLYPRRLSRLHLPSLQTRRIFPREDTTVSGARPDLRRELIAPRVKLRAHRNGAVLRIF